MKALKNQIFAWNYSGENCMRKMNLRISNVGIKIDRSMWCKTIFITEWEVNFILHIILFHMQNIRNYNLIIIQSLIFKSIIPEHLKFASFPHIRPCFNVLVKKKKEKREYQGMYKLCYLEGPVLYFILPLSAQFW